MQSKAETAYCVQAINIQRVSNRGYGEIMR